MHSNPGEYDENYHQEETEEEGYVAPESMPEDDEVEVIEIPGEDDEEWEPIEDPEFPEVSTDEVEYEDDDEVEYEDEPQQ